MLASADSNKLGGVYSNTGNQLGGGTINGGGNFLSSPFGTSGMTSSQLGATGTVPLGHASPSERFRRNLHSNKKANDIVSANPPVISGIGPNSNSLGF